MANSPAEAHALTEAAQLFLEAEWKDASLQCPRFEEHLTASINCFNHAIKVCGVYQTDFFLKVLVEDLFICILLPG